LDEWTNIQYRDFHDVPRMIVARKGEDAYLFYSKFDEQKDDYLDFYAVYRMPHLSETELHGSWVSLEDRALERLDDLPLHDLPFSVSRPSASGRNQPFAWMYTQRLVMTRSSRSWPAHDSRYFGTHSSYRIDIGGRVLLDSRSRAKRLLVPKDVEISPA
jgi:hypothetical protein